MCMPCTCSALRTCGFECFKPNNRHMQEVYDVRGEGICSHSADDQTPCFTTRSNPSLMRCAASWRHAWAILAAQETTQIMAQCAPQMATLRRSGSHSTPGSAAMRTCSRFHILKAGKESCPRHQLQIARHHESVRILASNTRCFWTTTTPRRRGARRSTSQQSGRMGPSRRRPRRMRWHAGSGRMGGERWDGFTTPF